MTYTPPPRTEQVFLHLRPGRYLGDLNVAKMVKTEDALVEPGDVVVKLLVTVSPDFFKTVRPEAQVEFTPEHAFPELAAFQADPVTPEGEI